MRGTVVFKYQKFSALLLIIMASLVSGIGSNLIYPQEKEDFKDFKELDIEDLLNKEVTIATKSRQKISEAPGIVTVITAEEIENMGARNLRDVLETVPGFEFSVLRIGSTMVGIRGTKDPRGTAKLLFLVDGVPFNTLMYGLSFAWGYEFNMDSIERIEIIRGPGSALYGRNAFNGVVNIITKSAQNPKNRDVKVIAEGGNYNTRGVGASFGVNREKYNFYFNVRKFNTDGHDPPFDNGRGGESPWKIYQDNLYMNVRAKLGNVEFMGIYTDHNVGSSHGPFVTDSYVETRRGSYSLRYQHRFDKKTQMTSKLLFQHLWEAQHIEVFKPNLPAPYGTLWPGGRYVTPVYNEYKYGVETEIRHTFADNHHLLAGIQVEKYGITKCKINSSYDLYAPGGPALFYWEGGEKIYYGKDDMPEDPRGWISGDGHHYHNLAFFIQDTFYPVHNLGITVGGRYDWDSEFGGLFNPRGGIVWEFAKSTNLKILYGQAYRAPNCQEQYKTVGFAIGNKDLVPEKIKTYEIGLGYRFRKVRTGINFFFNKLDDVIYVESKSFGEPNTYLNIGRNIASGFEVENRLILSKNFSMFLNYSYTKSEDKRDIVQDGILTEQTSEHIDVAPHKLNCGINLGFLKFFNLNATMIYRSKRENFPNVQNDIGPYTLINSTLIIKNFFKTLEISASVYNLFDERYHDQEAGTLRQPYQPGRSFIIRATYKF